MFTIAVATPGTHSVEAVVRQYMSEVASRWFEREATADEVDEALRQEPYDDLQGSTGVFFTASENGRAIGCTGIRYFDGTGELTKVFTSPDQRGRGVASHLLRAIDQACRERGISTMRLDTRSELHEACALYERHGFERVKAFNNDPYSDRWYSKELDGEIS